MDYCSQDTKTIRGSKFLFKELAIQTFKSSKETQIFFVSLEFSEKKLQD